MVKYEVVSVGGEVININGDTIKTVAPHNTAEQDHEQEKSQPKHDSQSRKYLLTANDPIPKGLDHDKIIEILMGFKGIQYFCMADEQGS